MTDHYRNLLRPDLSVDLGMLMRIAHRGAATERAGCAKIGWARSHAECLGPAMQRVWARVQAMSLSMRAELELAAMAPADQLATILEMHASFADSAIPPRRDESASLRSWARALNQKAAA